MKRIAALLVTMTAATLAASVPSGPASADAWASSAACLNGNGGTFADVNLAIADGTAVTYGRQTARWIGPGQPVLPGDVLRIRASGSMKIDWWPWGPSFSPAGSSQSSSPSWTGESLPTFGLIGTFMSTRQSFNVGTDSTCVQYHGTQPTYVVLSQNDPVLYDNSGRWDIVVRHYAY